MIKTKSIFEPASPDDGLRILVARTFPGNKPKNYEDQWLTLAPSKSLLFDWKHNEIQWEQYVIRFREEMLKPASRASIKRLAELSKTQTVTLLCWEGESNLHCHRHLLKEMIDGYA